MEGAGSSPFLKIVAVVPFVIVLSEDFLGPSNICSPGILQSQPGELGESLS